MKNCIYQIKSISTDRIYIGSAKSTVYRKSLHFRSLLKNKHHNVKLQNHYNKYGVSDLVFEIIEHELDLSDLISREQYYLDTLTPYFNICKIAGSALGRKTSEETKKKISNSLKGKEYTEERRMNMSVGGRGKKRRPFTEEHRKNLSKAMAGVKRPPQTKDHIEKRTKHLYGNAWNRGKPNRSVPVVQIKDGLVIKEYPSAKEAANQFQITNSNIIHAIKGRSKTAAGFQWKYKKDIISNAQTPLVRHDSKR